jgi:hypothetical protein
MPRTARRAPGGVVFHVLNRGVGRRCIFEKDEDFSAFGANTVVGAQQCHAIVLNELEGKVMNRARQLMVIAGISLIAGVVGLLHAGLSDIFSVPQLSLVSAKVVGNELRAVLIASRRTQGPFDHSAITSELKGYLMVIDLSSKAPLARRTKFYGPLFDVPNPRSSMSFDAAAMYSDEDAKAARMTPQCILDRDGNLLRFRWDPSQKAMIRESLVLQPNAASWKEEGVVKQIRNVPGLASPDVVLSTYERYLVVSSGSVKVYDLYTGNETRNPWLRNCVTQLRGIQTGDPGPIFLTEPPDHVVAFATAATPTIAVNGKEYRSSDVGLAYTRPNPLAHVFRFHGKWPDNAFVIDNTIYLYFRDEHFLRLSPIDGGKSLEYRATAKERPLDSNFPHLIQQSPSMGLIVNYDPEFVGNRLDLFVTRWDYRNNAMLNSAFDLTQVFGTADAEFHPKQLVAVKQSF